MLYAAADAVDQVVDVSEIESLFPVTLDDQVLAAAGILDEHLPYSSADATLAIQRRRTNDCVGQIENLVIRYYELLSTEFEGAVYPQRIAHGVLADLGAVEIPVHHARREIDEVLHPSSRDVEGVLECPEAVIERMKRILVGASGMRDGGEQHDHLRLQFPEQKAEPEVVPGIFHVERDLRGAEQLQPLVDDRQVQITLRQLARLTVQRQEVVDLKAVNDRDICPAPLELQGKVVPDEAGASDKDNSLPCDVLLHDTTSLIAAFNAPATRRMSSSFKCGPTGSAIDRSLIFVAFGKASAAC